MPARWSHPCNMSWLEKFCSYITSRCSIWGCRSGLAVMILSVGCTLSYQVFTPVANFTLNVLANRDAFQLLLAENLTFVPEVPQEKIATSKGNRVVRVE